MEVFADDVDRQVFLSLLGELVSAGVLIIHCFCLMLTHIHLLAETPPWGELNNPRLQGEGFRDCRLEIDYRPAEVHLVALRCIA